MKSLGTLPGFPDLLIIGPKDVGMFFVEMKGEGGLNENQRKFRDAVLDLGWPFGVARSIDDMQALSRKWGLPVRDPLGRVDTD